MVSVSRRHVGVVAVVALLAFAMTIRTRSALDSIGASAEIGASGGDIVVGTLSDPVFMTLFVVPAVTLMIAISTAERSNHQWLLRQGSHFAHLQTRALRGLGTGALTGAAITLIAVLACGRLGSAAQWSPLVTSGLPDVAAIEAFADRGLTPVAALLLQITSLTLWSSVVGAACALLALRIRGLWFTAAVAALALTPLLVYHSWPLSAGSNPINAVLAFHGVGLGAPTFYGPSISVGLVAAMVGLTWLRERRRTVQFSARHVHLLIVTAGALLLFGADSTATLDGIVRSVNYGAGEESWSITYWAYSTIVWLGGAYLLVVRWSALLSERSEMILIRCGSVTPLLLRECRYSVLFAASLALWTLALAAVIALTTGASLDVSTTTLVHQAVNGPLQLMVYGTTAGAAMLWSQRSTAGLAALGACLTLSLPISNPGFVFPFGLAGHGATDSLSITRISLTLSIAMVIAGAAVVLAAKSRPFDIQ